MRRFAISLCLLASLSTWSGVAHAEGVHTGNGWSVRVDPQTGDYAVATAEPAWSVGGSIGHPLSDVATEHGKDAVGPYERVRFAWQDGGRRGGSIRIYDDRPLAMFSVKYEDAVTGSPVPFPVLTKLPANLLAFRYGEKDHLLPEQFKAESADPAEQYGGPLALFDDHANAMVLSPASHFMIGMVGGDFLHGISCGLNRTLTGVPAGFEQQTLVSIGHGINATWDAWGHGLTDLYGKARPANDADTGLKYLGYWTDNGAHYYYNFDLDKGYTGTLLAVRDYLKEKGVPIRYMQLDSWWYPKTFDSFQQQAANKSRSKDPRIPAGTWNRYGGLMEFAAAPELFPNGLGAFQRELGLPLVLHNRWIDPKSPYHDAYKISGVVAVDPRWWDKIASDIAGWGAMTYEQDWNNWIYLKSPELSTTTWAGDAYMDGMAKGCADHHLTMQYCMIQPRGLLQGGAKYPNLTSVRVSTDRFDRSRWHSFLYGSKMADALGVWPWTDVYRSSETPNILISTLSAGMVGLSDKMGDENLENIFRAVRKDGVIVKPDAPLVPTDASYVAEARSDKAALVSTTRTGDARYVFACTREPKQPDVQWNVDPKDLGIPGEAVSYDMLAGTVAPLGGTLTKSHDWAYRVVVPIGPSGLALIGDAGLFVTRGRQRIAAVNDDGKAVHATVLFAKGESVVTLAAYAPAKPTVDAKGGSVGDASYDAASKLARVQVRVDPAGVPNADGVVAVDVSIGAQ